MGMQVPCISGLYWLNCYYLLFTMTYAVNISTPMIDNSLEEMVRLTCLERTGYKPLDDNTLLFRVVEVPEYENVSLPCSYCGESSVDTPRIWLRSQRVVNVTVEEVELGLGPILEENRIFTFPNHTLFIHNVTSNDSGFYYCRNYDQETVPEFQFSLDVVEGNVPVVEGKTTSWEKYRIDNILKINQKINNSKVEEISELLDNTIVEITSEWDPWQPCDGCAGLRRRYAKCRLRSKLNRIKYPDMVNQNLTDIQLLLRQSVVLSCHSLILAQWFPHLYSMTSSIPNYLQVHACYDHCVLSDRMKHEPRYQQQINMDVGTSLSFVCPESDLKSKVIWRKDGVVIKPIGTMHHKKSKKAAYTNPFTKNYNDLKFERAFVDRMNVLQLCMVGHKETALYVCYVNNVIMKSLNISVVTAEETQQQRYYHFLLVSIYTSIMSSVVVIIGIGWAFIRRSEFTKVIEE